MCIHVCTYISGPRVFLHPRLSLSLSRSLSSSFLKTRERYNMCPERERWMKDSETVSRSLSMDYSRSVILSRSNFYHPFIHFYRFYYHYPLVIQQNLFLQLRPRSNHFLPTKFLHVCATEILPLLPIFIRPAHIESIQVHAELRKGQTTPHGLVLFSSYAKFFFWFAIIYLF